ncbi:MAG: hypothetical protein AAF799_21180 [Myxococcota bacterium]
MNDDARALLEQYRRDCEPSSEATASLHRRVSEAVAAPSTATTAAGTSSSTLGILIGGGVLLLVLGGLWLGTRAEPDSTRSATPSAAAIVDAPAPEPAAEPPVVVPSAAEVAVPPVPSPAPESEPPESESESEATRPTATARSPRRTRRPAPAPPPSADTLAEETLLLRRAQQALSKGDPRQSLQVLAEHERRFPRGLLVKERGSMRVIALCRADDPRAKTELTKYLRRHPATPYRDRLEHACGEQEE